jgi:Phosphotransferase enzyme family
LERSEQSDREIYRVIVLRQGGTEVLLAPNATGFSLPEVTIPRWQRVAENLTAAMKSQWGEEVICLFQPDLAALVPGDNQICYEVAEHWRHSRGADVPTKWVSVDDLHQSSFASPYDQAITQQSLADCVNSARGSFAQLGWFKELYEWVEEGIAPGGIHLSGNFSQLNASPSFSLIRFETDGPAAWFKAVGEPNLRELSITLTLARLFPKHLPRVLATLPASNGWLTSEVEGAQLGLQEIGLWKAAAETLAGLQVESIPETAQILDTGARDLRTAKLSRLIHPFLDVVGELMDRQAKVPPPVLSRKELASLGEQIEDALGLIEELGFPDTLGHLDPNPGNIVVSPNRCVFLDWAEACVGHPFFTFEYFSEHFRRAVGHHKAFERQVIESYAAQWEQLFPPTTVGEALASAPLLAVFAYAANTLSSDDERLRDPATAGYLRALTRRMNREACQLRNRRSPCLS